MKKVLIDTSILIDFLRRKDKEKSLLFKLLRLNRQPAIALITHAELFAGKSVWRKKKARQELTDLIAGLEIILPNEEVSQLAGKFRAKYQINLLDAMIAAEAVISQLPLLTLNLKDFQKIRGLKLFTFVDKLSQLS